MTHTGTQAPPAALALEAELVGDERAIRHLIGEQKAIASELERARAREKLAVARLKAITTRNHPAVAPRTPGLPHGERFPDVSSYQPNVEWGSVRHASSVRVGALAVTKLTEGGGWTDGLGQARLAQMKALGFESRGAYHFLHPSISPREQADHFLAAGGAELGPADIAVCDAEVSDGESATVVQAAVLEFSQELRSHISAQRWLYCGGPFAREFGLTLNGYTAHWLPAYVSNPAPYMVFGRGRVVAWQYTDGRYGPVPHVCPGVGACDMSIIL